MNYLRGISSGWQTAASEKPSVTETVDKLCDRATTSTLLEDRRDAARGLKSLSKKYRLEVGTQAMPVIVDLLKLDREDTEIVGYLVNTLNNIMSQNSEEDTESDGEQYKREVVNAAEELGVQFTEMFLKNEENVDIAVSLLDEFDFQIRWPTVKLLTTMLINARSQLQSLILVRPMGVSKLMDLLSDSREIIRNDSIILLDQLVKGNAAIQKIVAFENAFDKILNIIEEEGNASGGVIVEDCLHLLLNLLHQNSSNQTFFKEGSFIHRLSEFFSVSGPEEGWAAQKVSNVLLMLRLIRSLVAPGNAQQLTSACQTVIAASGLLQRLCDVLMFSGVPVDVLTETINTVSEVIRSSPANQSFFSSVSAPSNPPRPAVVVLLMSMVNERQPFLLRCSVLYCFQCFLHKNPKSQSEVVATLLPQKIESSDSLTVGHLLCGGLFSRDALSNWFSAVALSHAIKGNTELKEQLIRVQLATSIGNPPVSLLHQIVAILGQGGPFQSRLGLLHLLSVWLSDCPSAVSHFLSLDTGVPYLVGQIADNAVGEENLAQGVCAFLLGLCVRYNNGSVSAFSRDNIRHIVDKRVGLETFSGKLAAVYKSEFYARSSQTPQLRFVSADEVFFDFEFTCLFKKLEGLALEAVQSDGDVSADREEECMRLVGLLSERDREVEELREKLEELANQGVHKDLLINQCNNQIQTLKDQYNLLRITNQQLEKTDSGIESVSKPREGDSVESLSEKLSYYMKINEDLKQRIDGEGLVGQEGELQQRYLQLQHSYIELQQSKQELQRANEEFQSYIDGGNSPDVLQENFTLRISLAQLQDENQCLGLQLRQLRSEQEDLLVLFHDQSSMLENYGHQLQSLGVSVDNETVSGESGSSSSSSESEVENSAGSRVGELTVESGYQLGNYFGESDGKQLGNFHGETGKQFGNFAGETGKQLGNFPGETGEQLGNFPGETGKQLGNFPGETGNQLGNFPGETGNQLGNFPGETGKHLGNFPGETGNQFGNQSGNQLSNYFGGSDGNQFAGYCNTRTDITRRGDVGEFSTAVGSDSGGHGNSGVVSGSPHGAHGVHNTAGNCSYGNYFDTLGGGL